MGVDYTAHYGIGIGIKTIDFDDESLSEEVRGLGCMEEYLDEKLDHQKYGWFQSGDGNYTGEINDFFVTINTNSPNEAKLAIDRDSELLTHIKDIGLEPLGEFGLIGGLEVW